MKAFLYLLGGLVVLGVLNAISPILMWVVAGLIALLIVGIIIKAVTMSPESVQELESQILEPEETYEVTDTEDDFPYEYDMLNPDGQVWDSYEEKWVTALEEHPRVHLVDEIEADLMTHPRGQRWDESQKQWVEDWP